MTTLSTITIDANKLDAFTKRVKQMQRKAVKLGFEPIVLVSVSAPVEREVTRTYFQGGIAEDMKVLVRECEVVIEGELPVFDGWTVLCKIEHTEGGNLVYGKTTALSTREIREARPICRHCHQKRERKATYFIGTKEQIMQVGGSCLKDFTRSTNPEREFNYGVELIALLSDDEGHWAADVEKGVSGLSVINMLAVASVVVAKNGYVPRTSFSGIPTADIVLDLLDSRTPSTIELGDEDYAKAQAIIDWARAQKPDNTYMHNAQVLLSNETVSHRSAGLVVSLATAYDRYLERIAREEREAVAINEHVGAVKERLRGLELTVEMIRYFDNMYGTTTMVLMRDADGRTFKWMASGVAELDKGNVVVLDGTVKAHEEYNETKQTVLTRCKIKEAA